MTLAELAAGLTERLARAPVAFKMRPETFRLHLVGDAADGAGTLHMIVGRGLGGAWVGEGPQPSCIVTLSTSDAQAIIAGTANPVLLFVMRRITVQGDLSGATRLGELLR